MLTTLRSAWAWTAVTILLVLGVLVVGTVYLFDRDPGRYTTGRWFRRIGSMLTRVNPLWRIQVDGHRVSEPRTPYIVVCNHQSNADIPVISRLPWEMKWVAKASLFQMPVVGWMMRMSDDIPVDRHDRRSRALVLRHAADRLSKHVSVMLFPEGTRSRDGLVHRFNDGAFRLAIAEGHPVLPLAIDGTLDALPKKDWRFGKADVRLRVLEPVPTTGLSADDAPALRETVRQRIVDCIAEWRDVSAEEVDGEVAAVATA